jgi:hypothetical protein
VKIELPEDLGPMPPVEPGCTRFWIIDDVLACDVRNDVFLAEDPQFIVDGIEKLRRIRRERAS